MVGRDDAVERRAIANRGLLASRSDVDAGCAGFSEDGMGGAQPPAFCGGSGCFSRAMRPGAQPLSERGLREAVLGTIDGQAQRRRREGVQAGAVDAHLNKR